MEKLTLALQEIKKNSAFFIIMTLVLSLLLSAGASLFNFSFEINREIVHGFERQFEFGHEEWLDGFVETNDEFMQNGVHYIRYSARPKSVVGAGAHNALISVCAYQFEHHLPIAMQRAYDEFDDFLIDGVLWTEESNGMFDGKFPIFLSDLIVELAYQSGFEINIGDVLYVYERVFLSDIVADGDADYRVVYKPFFVKGIYRWSDIPFRGHLPIAAISLAAELAFREATDSSIWDTRLIFASLEDLIRFNRFAVRQGLNFVSWIIDEIDLVGAFSGIFASVSIVILLLSGFVVFIYAGMIINKRMQFIGILKAMGMTNFKVSKMFFVMILAAFIIAFILGNIFSIFINAHFSYLAYSLFDQSLNLGFNIVSQMILLGSIVLIAFLASLLLFRKIQRISIAKVLTSKE